MTAQLVVAWVVGAAAGLLGVLGSQRPKPPTFLLAEAAPRPLPASLSSALNRRRWRGAADVTGLVGVDEDLRGAAEGLAVGVVVGGGDSALEEASFVTRFASRVTIVHRRDSFRASKIMRERALGNDKIAVVWDTEVLEAFGEDRLASLCLRNLKTGEESSLDATGLFIAIGHDPRSEIAKGQVEFDDEGYVLVHALHSTATNLQGVFAAGDLVDHTYRQAITAAGSGCVAALDAERYLAANEGTPVQSGAGFDNGIPASPPDEILDRGSGSAPRG